MSYESDLLKPYVPPGFEAFWRENTAEAMAAPLDFDLSEQGEYDPQDHHVRAFQFRGIDGATRSGWIAAPKGHEVSPGFLWLAPYSRWTMLPNRYGTRAGMVSISFNFHGESAFHREDYTPERGYMAEGIECRDSWIFRRMYQDSVIVGRILQSLPEVDADRIVAAGMSQGGGLAIWMGAWVDYVKAVVADEPFLTGVPWILDAKYFRYPLKEMTDIAFSSPEMEAKVRETLSYFDTVNQAAFCGVPTRVTLGIKDPSVRPAQVKAVYETLPGVKAIEELDWGHDWHPRMIEGAEEFLRDVVGLIQ
ncbi:MAG: acetylxylan esterase [Fimbriimonadaceae bacterium]